MSVWFWVGFLLLVLLLLAFDLGVTNRRARVVTTGAALLATIFYVALALLFNIGVFFVYEHGWMDAGAGHDLPGKQAALQFFTAWILEKSLSLDNIFVIALVFAYFRIPAAEQHRVLFWGILGAIVLRGALIGFGAVLMSRFDWIVYVFGVVLLLTAVKMLVVRHDNLEPERNLLVRLARRLYPVTEELQGSRFFVKQDGRRAITPLFLALLMVEGSDLLFAFDSIPAAFAVTRDPFLVFTSNIFAVLGLRALYFVLAGLIERFRYLKMSLVFILAYVGVKMLLSHVYPIPTPVSLAIVLGMTAVGVLASWTAAGRDTARLLSPLAGELEHMGRITLRQARRVVIALIGSTLFLLGLVMLVTPGPGTLMLLAGLAVLGVEFAWAKRWLARTKAKTMELEQSVRNRLGRKRGGG